MKAKIKQIYSKYLKNKVFITTVCFLFSPHAIPQNYKDNNEQIIQLLEKRIDALERKIDKLEDRIETIRNEITNSRYDKNNDNRLNSCSSSDYVKLIKDRNIVFPVAEKLCPYQCAKLIQNYQKDNPNHSYECTK